ncbi:helix-turn-helix transcriptional regulator [Cysteiniphilum halobium]|uniref:helix-turn-helix transcriptional regulator n=1 Tax=Cysteiniphilum halobium TaxID=2219059 RepID=UPI000E657CC7|nr:LuxR C-terminal-related transcriptional regulator [Cysteiniphilum halobium]
MTLFSASRNTPLIKKFEKWITEAKTFKEIGQISIKYSHPIKRMFHLTLPNEQLLNFTFIRTHNDLKRNIVTLEPMLALKFYRQNLHIDDHMLDRNLITPFYDRVELMNPSYQKAFIALTSPNESSTPIVIEHDLDFYKDAFCFQIANHSNKDFITGAWFATFLQMIIAFYNFYSPQLTPNFPSYDTRNTMTEFRQDDLFQDFIAMHDLTPTQGQYLKYLVFSWESKRIATHLCRSERTVEKVIDAIKLKLNLHSKQELCRLLQCYYINLISERITNSH